MIESFTKYLRTQSREDDKKTLQDYCCCKISLHECKMKLFRSNQVPQFEINKVTDDELKQWIHDLGWRRRIR